MEVHKVEVKVTLKVDLVAATFQEAITVSLAADKTSPVV